MAKKKYTDEKPKQPIITLYNNPYPNGGRYLITKIHAEFGYQLKYLQTGDHVRALNNKEIIYYSFEKINKMKIKL